MQLREDALTCNFRCHRIHEQANGHYVMLPYNLIRQEVASPIHGHGYTRYDDGRMVVFRAESDEPTRVHPTPRRRRLRTA